MSSPLQRINITQFDNCVDVPLHYEEAHVQAIEMEYERDADGYCDTLHGKYIVREQHESEGTEVSGFLS